MRNKSSKRFGTWAVSCWARASAQSPAAGIKKKLHTCFGKLEVGKAHPLSRSTGTFGISAKLQELICLLAQDHVFEDAEELLGAFLGVSVSAKQIQRVSEHYGEKLEDRDASLPVPEVAVNPGAPVYIAMDGSMIFTREDGWKEAKLGRIYAGDSRVAVQEGRTEILDSLYVCVVGSNTAFLEKFDPCVQPYGHKVFLGDGAKWIWNWVEDYYGQSVQILDFYHAVEKLGTYAALAYEDPHERRRWLELQQQRLKADGVLDVVGELKQRAARRGESGEEGKALGDVIRYYESNLKRMLYGTFLQKGYLIGSGAIESAHRTVIQQRLKLSGQRWSIAGAQRIANLRACQKSNRWGDLIKKIKRAA